MPGLAYSHFEEELSDGIGTKVMFWVPAALAYGVTWVLWVSRMAAFWVPNSVSFIVAPVCSLQTSLLPPKAVSIMDVVRSNRACSVCSEMATLPSLNRSSPCWRAHSVSIYPLLHMMVPWISPLDLV